MHTKREGRGHFYFPYAIHSIGKQQTKNGYEDMHTYSDYSSKINKSFNNMFFHSRDYSDSCGFSVFLELDCLQTWRVSFKNGENGNYI